jgi:Autophagy-related protein C terminal domain
VTLRTDSLPLRYDSYRCRSTISFDHCIVSSHFLRQTVTWHPRTRVTPNNEIVSDEAEIAFRMLPLRCMIDQKAIRFIRAYFRSDEIGVPSGPHRQVESRVAPRSSSSSTKASRKLYNIPPPLFRSYRFLQFKLKVDYRPEKLDAAAIYNGALVELINLSPIDGLVLTLQQVRGEDQVGFGAVATAIVSHWLQDVCATQLHKFVTSARAVDPFANVGSAAVDMVVLPWEAIQNGESIRRALRAGTTAFASTVVTETLNVGSRLTKFMADQVARRATPSLGMNVLPSRPLDAPRDLRDATPHVLETLTRGLQAANYTVVIVPYREYHRRGAAGAITSVLRGIPVAIAAPASGAAEAFSYAAIGVRNQVRPDLRREEEASLRGLHSDGLGRR